MSNNTGTVVENEVDVYGRVQADPELVAELMQIRRDGREALAAIRRTVLNVERLLGIVAPPAPPAARPSTKRR